MERAARTLWIESPSKRSRTGSFAPVAVLAMAAILVSGPFLAPGSTSQGPNAQVVRATVALPLLLFFLAIWIRTGRASLSRWGVRLPYTPLGFLIPPRSRLIPFSQLSRIELCSAESVRPQVVLGLRDGPQYAFSLDEHDCKAFAKALRRLDPLGIAIAYKSSGRPER